MFSVERLARLAETSSFRHAAVIAYVFLLMAVGSMLLSSHQTEKLLQDHVRDMVLMDVQSRPLHLPQADYSLLLTSLVETTRHDRDAIYSLLVDANGRVLFGESFLKHLKTCSSDCKREWIDTNFTDEQSRHYRFFGMQVPLANGGYYLAAYDILPMQERVRVIPLVAGAGLFVVLLTSLCLGLYSSMRSMRRVDRIRQGLHRYVGGERHTTVPVNERGDEFDQLGSEINRMLGQINHLMDELKDVSGHIAHELRTPLTRLHHQLINAVDVLDEGPARQHILGALDEAERVQRMFKAILRIGEIESARCSHAFEWFDVEGLLIELADYYQPMADEGQTCLRIKVTPGWQLYGDRALLFQATANLLENAFKYGRPGTDIVLLMQVTGEWVDLGVADQGQGIPAHLREDAVKRFRRLGQQGDLPGSGLGLALVSAIAKLHGGGLELQDNQPSGLLASLRLSLRHVRARTQLVDVLTK